MTKEYIDKDTLIEDAKTWFVTPDNSPLYDDIMRMVRNRVKLIPPPMCGRMSKPNGYGPKPGKRTMSNIGSALDVANTTSIKHGSAPTAALRWEVRKMIWHDPDKFFFDDSDVPDADVGEFAKDTNVLGNTVRIIDRGGIGLYNGQLATNPNRLTNADCIRAMSDEEMAEWLQGLKYSPSCDSKCYDDFDKYGEQRTYCKDCWLDWLKEVNK